MIDIIDGEEDTRRPQRWAKTHSSLCYMGWGFKVNYL